MFTNQHFRATRTLLYAQNVKRRRRHNCSGSYPLCVLSRGAANGHIIRPDGVEVRPMNTHFFVYHPKTRQHPKQTKPNPKQARSPPPCVHVLYTPFTPFSRIFPTYTPPRTPAHSSSCTRLCWLFCSQSTDVEGKKIKQSGFHTSLYNTLLFAFIRSM